MTQLQLCTTERQGTCSVCGNWFVAGSRGAIGKFCGKACRIKGRHAADRAIKESAVCVVCGKEFVRSRYNRKRRTCSDECNADAIVMRQTEMVDGECVRCGEAFRRRIQKPHVSTSGRYCSAWCQKRDQECGSKRLNRKAQRDKVSVKLSEIAERDGWVCQLCGEAVDPLVVGPHSRCASLDHIVPLSRGGSNDAGNLQLAHMGCNSRKQDRV